MYEYMAMGKPVDLQPGFYLGGVLFGFRKTGENGFYPGGGKGGGVKNLGGGGFFGFFFKTLGVFFGKRGGGGGVTPGERGGKKNGVFFTPVLRG